jgi:hypothetical protein
MRKSNMLSKQIALAGNWLHQLDALQTSDRAPDILACFIITFDRFCSVLAPIDYRCEDRNNVRDWCLYVGLESVQRTQYTPKKEPFSQDMRLKIPRLRVVLKWSNPKPGCREAANHLLEKQHIPPIDSWHRFHSDRCKFHLLILTLTLVLLLER